METERKRVYFVHANPEASKHIGEYLAARGEVAESETTLLEVAGRSYPCWQVKGDDVSFLRQYVKDNADIFTSVKLFERYEGEGTNAHDVTFMLRGQRRVRQAVLTAMSNHSPRSASALRGPDIIRRAK
jgi:hypothetical protein